MSYDSDFENTYMVEFQSGRVIHVGQYTVEDVKEYCADEHPDEVIKSIYEEVYTNDGEDDEYDGQPDEAQEWHDFDPEC
jgi:hypothetical protein